jgi:hypothetical protein
MAAKDVTFLSFLFVIDSEDFEGVAKLGVHAAALADSVDFTITSIFSISTPLTICTEFE